MSKPSKKNPLKPKSIDHNQKRHLKKRYQKEQRFRSFGVISILIAFLFLITLFCSIIINGYSAFTKTSLKLSFKLEESSLLDSSNNPNYHGAIKEALRKIFSGVESRQERLALNRLVGKAAPYQLRDYILNHRPELHQSFDLWVDASSDVDMFIKGKISKEMESQNRRLSDQQISWIESLRDKSRIRREFNVTFFQRGDSREPEQAGILGAMAGSFMMILVCIGASLPIGVLGAIYLEEFAAKNWLTDFIDININNLAAVPSIIFGLLGLSIYLNVMHLTRSSSLVGGLTLALLVLPVIIISTRNALKTIPPSIKFAATALGATKIQVLFIMFYRMQCLEL